MLLNRDAADVILLFNFAAVGIEGLQIHNRRGDDTLGHFGMASAAAKLSRGTSIGSVQFTDFVITNTTMMVDGH